MYVVTVFRLSVNSNKGKMLCVIWQVPFARYIARNGIQHMKRYNIERVYREKRMPSLHPIERTECAFDIVTTTPLRYVRVIQHFIV